MPWNNQIRQEYRNMMSGVMGDAFRPTFPLVETFVLYAIEKLERGYDLYLQPDNQRWLDLSEAFTLHWMRVACYFFAERNNFFPWSLRDKTVEQLRPLLNWDYQCIDKYYDNSGRYIFHGVWDINPSQRMLEAVLVLLFTAIFDEPLRNEMDVIVKMIQNMRDSGWSHVTGWWEEYEDYYGHSPGGLGTYDYDDVASVKKAGCHIMSAFIVSALRGFNIPSHIGLPWKEPGTKPTNWSELWNRRHKFGHCFVHYAIPDLYLRHGDDVYNRLLKTIPPEFALRTSWFAYLYIEDATRYEWTRGPLFDDYFWWIIFLGESTDPNLDVRHLYYTGQLRYKLENLHEEYGLADLDGAPASVPPIFDDQMVDRLMDYVTAKLT